MRLPMQSDEVHGHHSMTSEGIQTAGNNDLDLKIEIPIQAFC